MKETETIVLPEKNPAGRIAVPLLESWKFYKGPAAGACLPDYDDASWERIDLPHTWNNRDGEDGGSDYYRGTGWYRKSVRIDAAASAKRVYIEFKGVNSQMELFVNGCSAGRHKGGYTAFRFDITALIAFGRENQLAVGVSNAADPAIAPLSGDFTFFGGIYREVSLLFVEPVHIGLDGAGSAGVFLKTRCVPGKMALLQIRSEIKNETAAAKEILLRIVLRHPEHFTQNNYEKEYLAPSLRFDPRKMCGSGIVAAREIPLQIGPGAVLEISETIAVDAPRLWNGLADPYRYRVEFTVSEDGAVLDSYRGFIGFRSFVVDKERGFYLNGKPYPLRGVAMHQDYQGSGNAVTLDEMTQSFSFLYEIGANTVRLSHYPHHPYTYELCDKYGIVVYAEIPFVNTYGGSGTWEAPDAVLEEFTAVTKQQLTEMIRQEYNHPSVFCWGLYNEAQKASHSVMVPLVRALHELAHALDDTRPTVTATFSEEGELLQSDLLAWNTYPPPYGLRDNAQRFYQAMDGKEATDHPEKYAPFYIPRYGETGSYGGVLKRPVGISEYGVGGSIRQHTEDYTQISGTIKVQPEEFQAYCHETWINQIRDLDYLWGTYVWNLFDFSADNRDEATVPGVNTKGLVTRDRKTRKDAFYVYKAFWRTDRNILAIAGKNHPVRETNPTYFKIYSNCEAVTLFVDGRDCGTRRQEANALACVFEWPWTEALSYGEHVIRAVGRNAGNEAASDEMTILRKKHGGTTLRSDILWIDTARKQINTLPQLTAETLSRYLEGADGASYMLYAADRKTAVGAGPVSPGMTLLVTAEDGRATAYYTFIAPDPQKCFRITVPSETQGFGKTRLTDGDPATRWAGRTAFPADILLDFGEPAHLSALEIGWFEANVYRYRVLTSINGRDYTPVSDHTANSAAGSIRSSFPPVYARYVKITVTGTAGGDWISAYSISADAWRFRTSYAVDEEANAVIVPYDPARVVSKEEFITALGLEGDCTAQVTTGAAATVYYITDGAALEIACGGTCYRYRIVYR